MILVGAVAQLYAFEELVGDIGIAGSGDQRREPVETGEDAVLNRAGLDVSGPADDRGYAETAFPNSCLWWP